MLERRRRRHLTPRRARREDAGARSHRRGSEVHAATARGRLTQWEWEAAPAACKLASPQSRRPSHGQGEC